MGNEAIDTLGTIIGPDQKRDAVHVAVIPAVAAHTLLPGDHVGFLADGTMGRGSNRPLGIVDPFLAGGVRTNERFWLFVYPRQITSLRHVWTHPEIPEEGAGAVKAADAVAANPSKEESEHWLRDFVSSAHVPDYDTVIAAASGEKTSPDEYGDSVYCRNDGEYLTFIGVDAGGDIPKEFWDHLENLKGKKLLRAKHFSCS